MGMLLRTVDGDEVQAPVDARLSDDEFNDIIEILGGDSPSAKRLKERLRSKGDVYAWGIEDEVYGKVMDGDPMVVAVGSGDELSDYEIKYVTELEFCLHEDVCDEGLSRAIGLGSSNKYVMFSTIPPTHMTQLCPGKRHTLADLQNNLNLEISTEDKHNYVTEEEILLESIGIGESEYDVWVIPTGGSEEEQGELWDSIKKEFDTFYPSDVAYMGGKGEDRFKDSPEYGDIIIARSGREKTQGFGILQSDFYKEDKTEIETGGSRDWVRYVDWLIDINEKNMETDSLNGSFAYQYTSNFTKCGLDDPEEEMEDKYRHIKGQVNNKSSNSEFNPLEQKAEHKKALHQKLEEHRMKHNEKQEYIKLLEHEKQVLFYGPPGTGKTHTAVEEIAEECYHEDRTEFVTFHPSYSYEEFVQGIRPVTDSNDKDTENKEKDDGGEDGELRYKVKPGVFKELCKEAQGDEDKRYLLVIDEINRGNISSIFGELITLLEEDKRGDPENEGEEATKVSLPYSDHEDDDEDGFWVPENLHIIGTMNTADRSIAKLDVALRRRFAHVPFEPDIEELAKEEFDYGEDNGESATNFLRSKVDFEDEDDSEDEDDPVALSALGIREINERLMDDEFSVEAGKKIGHSYMMDIESEEEVLRTWKYEILPLLNEYFFDEYDKIAELLSTDDEDKVGNIVDTEMKKFEDFNWDNLEQVLKELADEQGD